MPLPSTALTLLVAASLTRDVVTGAAAAAIGLLAAWMGARPSPSRRP
ncbi:hypothetical protein [Rubrivirga sp. SAORIC476]|nr:hypothetical protein [Rubrivirga sp. SAORIC476]